MIQKGCKHLEITFALWILYTPIVTKSINQIYIEVLGSVNLG